MRKKINLSKSIANYFKLDGRFLLSLLKGKFKIFTFSSKSAQRSVKDRTSRPTESAMMFSETNSLPMDSMRNSRALGRFFM